MKTPKMVDAMSYIDDDLVSGAITCTKKKKNGWIKWSAMAACLCLVALGALKLPDWANDPVAGQGSKATPPTVVIGDTDYVICGEVGEAAILQECGLKAELTSDLAGEFISYLDYDGECYYTLTDNQTENIMYEYKPEPNTNIYIVLIDETYFAAIRRDSQGYHGLGGTVPAGVWPEGVDPVIASLAVIPAGVDLLDVADAILVSISEDEARVVEDLGAYIPSELPEECRYGKAGHYKTMMKDGTAYQMLRVTYESGETPVPAPVPENAQTASEMTGDTAFLWMVWGHRPDTDLPVYQPEAVSASLIEQQNGRVFYIDYDGIYVGVKQLDISAEDLFAVIESIG